MHFYHIRSKCRYMICTNWFESFHFHRLLSYQINYVKQFSLDLRKISIFPLNVVGNTVEQWVAQRRLVLLLILPIWKIVRSSPLQFQHCRIWSVCIKEWFISHFCHLQWSLVANWLLFFCQPPAIFLIATCSFHRLGRQIAHYHGSLVRLCFFSL